MNSDRDEFWGALPEKALHPLRVPIVEALWRIGEPLSAVGLVDVLDGYLSMCDAAHHLRALEELEVVDPCPADAGSDLPEDLFRVPYRLKERNSGDGA